MVDLDRNNFRQTIPPGTTVLDVRNCDEFRCDALPNAKNIPLAILPLVAQQRLNKHKPVLVYCQSGGRAKMAEKILIRLGFTNVTNIGGIHTISPALG